MITVIIFFSKRCQKDDYLGKIISSQALECTNVYLKKQHLCFSKKCQQGWWFNKNKFQLGSKGQKISKTLFSYPSKTPEIFA